MKRKVNVVVDNDSWVIPFAKTLVANINARGDKAVFVRDYNDLPEADVSFYLGCVNLTPPAVLARSKKNLVAHASDLPKGRGFSPMTYMILEGKNDIPLCLLEMAESADAGPIVFKESIKYEGHELLGELQQKLGQAQVDICLKYLSENMPDGVAQNGEPSFYKRRKPEDSKIDPNKTISEQFNQFRVADNEKYPVYFEKDGKKYILKIYKA